MHAHQDTAKRTVACHTAKFAGMDIELIGQIGGLTGISGADKNNLGIERMGNRTVDLGGIRGFSR